MHQQFSALRTRTPSYLLCVVLLFFGTHACAGSVADHAPKKSHNFVTTAVSPLDLSNWMGAMWPLLSKLTLLDLSLPGTHDTLTSDLSNRIADNANDLPPDVAWLLHDLVPDSGSIGTFIRHQAQSQRLDIGSQLNAGVRFLDIRVTFTGGPTGGSGGYQWYGVHMVETEQPVIVYLTEIHSWLAAHPNEFLVMAITRHGNFCLNGTDQYPGTSPGERQAFWSQIEALFGDLLVDHSSLAINETSLEDLRARGGRMVIYASDYVNFTGSSNRALDSCLIFNDLQGGFFDEAKASISQLHALEQASEMKAKLKSQNRFWLMSLATSGSGESIEYAVLLSFQPFDHEKLRTECARMFNIPNVTNWCPLTLLDMSQAAEYYNQRVFAKSLLEGFEFPNGIYTDAIETNGTVLVGTETDGHVSDSNSGDRVQPHNTARYAYVATLLQSVLLKHCSRFPVHACVPLKQQINLLLQTYDVTTWTDLAHARLQNWPPL